MWKITHVSSDTQNCLLKTRKAFLQLLYNDFVSITADGTSVFTFLCTRNVGPEEVSQTAAYRPPKCTETKLLKCSLKVLNDNFLMSETQKPIVPIC